MTDAVSDGTRNASRGITAFFCSTSCPGDLVLRSQDWANCWSSYGFQIVGGFHTPVEREALRIFLRSRTPVIYVLARTLIGARIPASIRRAEKDGLATIISPFPQSVRRTTAAPLMSAIAISLPCAIGFSLLTHHRAEKPKR